MSNPIITMITPGRRALGEDWRKVTIGILPEKDKIGVVSNEATAQPVDGVPIYVPALGNLSTEMADFILEWQRKEAEYRARRPRRARTETLALEINRAWLDYVEMKLRMLKGITVSGRGGTTQRERINAGTR